MADVYARISRPDGYEDVHPDLVIEDAIPHTAFEIADATAEIAALRATATYALAVLTRLADSAYRWAGRDVPPGLVSEIDEAKARLAGVLS
jgi:hypothetical protein